MTIYRSNAQPSLLDYMYDNPKNKGRLSQKAASAAKHSIAARKPVATMHYTQITAFKDREGKTIQKSLVFETCDSPWSSDWKSYNAGKAAMEAVNSQVNRRFQQGEARYRAEERAEPQSEAILRKKLIKGISGEFAFYDFAKQRQFKPTDVMQPRDDGPSWYGDIIFFDGSYGEIKTTEGEFIPGQYRRLVNLPIAEKKRQYSRNSPSFVFNVADQFGNTTRQHTCKVARKASFTNEFLVGQRHRVVKSATGRRTHQYKISFIVRMVDLQRRVEKDGEMVDVWDLVTVPWDDESSNMKGFCKGKARLIEDLLIEIFTEYRIPFYKFADNRFVSNTIKPKIRTKITSPVSVQNIGMARLNGKFACLYDSDED